MTTEKLESMVFGTMIVFLAFLVLIAAAPIVGVGSMRAQSDYTGYVVDVEHNKGVVFRTTQIHLKTHPRSSESEEFCVRMPDDREILGLARNALRNSYRVRVEYQRDFVVPPTECKPGLSVVTNIERMNATGES